MGRLKPGMGPREKAKPPVREIPTRCAQRGSRFGPAPVGWNCPGPVSVVGNSFPRCRYPSGPVGPGLFGGRCQFSGRSAGKFGGGRVCGPSVPPGPFGRPALMLNLGPVLEARRCVSLEVDPLGRCPVGHWLASGLCRSADAQVLWCACGGATVFESVGDRPSLVGVPGSHPTRLETRTEESGTCASRRV